MVAFRGFPALTWIATRLGPIDAELGALSYPAYISHLLVFALLYQTSLLSLPWSTALPLALVSLIAFSIVLDRLIADYDFLGGFGYIIVAAGPGNATHEQTVKHMTLFQTEVMPALKQYHMQKMA